VLANAVPKRRARVRIRRLLRFAKPPKANKLKGKAAADGISRRVKPDDKKESQLAVLLIRFACQQNRFAAICLRGGLDSASLLSH